MAKAKRPQQRSQARKPAAGQPSQAAKSTAQAKSSASSTADSAKTPGASTAGSPRLARTGAIRTPQRNPSRFSRQPWWRRNIWTISIVGGVIILVGVLIWLANRQNQIASVGVGDPVPATVMTQLETVPASVSAQVGNGGLKSAFQATPKGTAVLKADGKPLLVYVGGDYCPYCAATRWSTVVALSRFGSFTGLTLMRSSPIDVYANTATFSFYKSTYTSKYISFSATEIADRDQNPLATLGPTAQNVFSTYDTAPYTTQTGGVPFFSYGNQYVTTNTIFVPTMLQGLTWQQIASQLTNPNSDVTKAIVGGANGQTAAICKLTGDQPASVCKTAEIQQLEAALPVATK